MPALRAQRGIVCLLHALAMYVEPEEHLSHLGALAYSLAPPACSVEERVRALARLQVPCWAEWFGEPSDRSLAVLFATRAEGESYARLFGKPRRRRALRPLPWQGHPLSPRPTPAG